MVLAKQMVIGMAFYSFVALTQQTSNSQSWASQYGVYIFFGRYSSSEEGNILSPHTPNFSFLYPLFSLIFLCVSKTKNSSRIKKNSVLNCKFPQTKSSPDALVRQTVIHFSQYICLGMEVFMDPITEGPHFLCNELIFLFGELKSFPLNLAVLPFQLSISSHTQRSSNIYSSMSYRTV